MHNLLTLEPLLPFAQFALSASLLAFGSLVSCVFWYRVQTKATHTFRAHCVLNQKDEVNQQEYSISEINITHE